MSRKKKNSRKNEVMHGPTYGASPNGKLGKALRIILVVLIVIFGSVVIVALENDAQNDIHPLLDPQEQTAN